MMYDFDWDEANTNKIRIKHGIKTHEVESAFEGIKKLYIDVKHSKTEKRYILIGISNKSRWLFISFTIRKNKIRIISARRMHKKEIEIYEKETL